MVSVPWCSPLPGEEDIEALCRRGEMGPRSIPPPRLRHRAKFVEYPAGDASCVVHLPKFLYGQSTGVINTNISDVLKHAPTILKKKIVCFLCPSKDYAAGREYHRHNIRDGKATG